MSEPGPRETPAFVRYGAYPFVASIAAVAAWWSLRAKVDLGRAYGAIFAFIAIYCIAVETLYPLDVKWRMNKRSFLRDIAFFAVGGPTIALANGLAGFIGLRVGAGRAGPLSGVSPLLAVPAALLLFELINYTYHRASHELGGRLGAFLWRVHAVHHVPDKVYVLMHGVAHPINTLVIRFTAMILPPALLGLDAEAVFVYNLVNNLQGIVSHWNVDVRVGPWNYVFVGVELHRMHHSADPRESKNFGAVLPWFDMLFGTFVYRPGRVPERLGVEAPADYPAQSDVLGLLRLPFARRA